jgi:CubicO group peptidase (beta-lactamase class C family)
MKPWRTDLRHVSRLAAAPALLLAAVVTGWPVASRAESPLAAPSTFSPDKLKRVGDYIRNEIATGKIPGAILLIQQHGKPVYLENFGVRDTATGLPMIEDTIFRLYSMTKPITSVAAMMLVEDGKLALGDPVSRYIPDFADVKVGIEKPGEEPALVLEPLTRPMSIEDLLRHTSVSPMASTATARYANCMRGPACSMAMSIMPGSSNGLRNCRWPNSRGRCGIMAIRPMFSAVS